MEILQSCTKPWKCICDTFMFIPTLEFKEILINSLRPSDAMWCETSWSTLVQVMAWHLTGNKPLTEPM